LSVHNITSHLRLNLPDSTSIPSSHPIVKPCRVKQTPSNSGGSELGIHSVSSELFSLHGPSFDELIVFDPSLVLSSLSLAHRGLFMCSGQSFEFPHGAIFGRAVVNFDWVSGTPWDRGWQSFDWSAWRRWSGVTNYQRNGRSGSGSSCYFFNSFPSSPFLLHDVFEHSIISSSSESFPLCSDRSSILSDKDFKVSGGSHFKLEAFPRFDCKRFVSETVGVTTSIAQLGWLSPVDQF